MKSLSLTARLSLLISTTVLLVMILTGMALYQSLAQQISVRDDAALLNRMDQIRTLLLNEDVLELIRTKPRLFANMLGNTESLLVLSFPGQPPLIEVNPGKATIPDIPAVPALQPLALKNVRHELARDGTPFISASALAKTRNGPGEVEIITGRLMTERTSTLAGYRHQMLLLIIVATVIAALSVAFLTRRGLRPLHRLAQETAAIDVRHLATSRTAGATGADGGLQSNARSVGNQLSAAQPSVGRYGPRSAHADCQPARANGGGADAGSQPQVL